MSLAELPETTEAVEPPPIRVLGFADAGLTMTAEEFDALTVEDVDIDYRHELIRGVLVVTPIPSEEESNPNEELGYDLRLYKKTHPNGSALDTTLPERYVFLPDKRRRADRVIWAGLGRMPDPKRDVPTIVVEFVSPGKRNWRRDDVEKRREYLAAGVREYWIIDRILRTLTVVRATPTGPVETVVPEGEIYRTEILPGFELRLSGLLAEADRWKGGPPPEVGP